MKKNILIPAVLAGFLTACSGGPAEEVTTFLDPILKQDNAERYLRQKHPIAGGSDLIDIYQFYSRIGDKPGIRQCAQYGLRSTGYEKENYCIYL